MKVFYDKIDEDILPLSVSFTFEEEDDKVAVNNFSGELIKGDGIYLLRGSMDVALACVCDRCMENTEIKTHGTVSVGVQPGGQAAHATDSEYEMNDEDGDVYITDPEYMDLHEILRQEAMLMLPAKRLCSDACKGLPYAEDTLPEEEEKNMPFKRLSMLKKKPEES